MGKGGRYVKLTIYHHPVPLSCNLGTLTSWNPLGLSRPVMGLLYLSFADSKAKIAAFRVTTSTVKYYDLGSSFPKRF